MTRRSSDSRPCVFLRLCDRARVLDADGSPIRFPTHKSLALFVYLARAGDAGAARDHLSELFWPGRPDHDARRALRGTLHEMRSAMRFGDDKIVRQARDRVSLKQAAIATDLDFEKRDCATTAGDFLVGLEIGAPGFDHWCAEERARLRDAALNTMVAAMETCLAEGRFGAAHHTTEQILVLD